MLDLYDASIADLQAGLTAGTFTSADLVSTYLARIEEVNLKGPALRAVLSTNANALAEARDLDRERQNGSIRGALHGIPILVKDSIHVLGQPTTCGSTALRDAMPAKDAHIVGLLRKAGVVFLGKTTLSQWCNARDHNNVASGWNAIMGQSFNPFHPKGSPVGSSSGSGVATNIGLAAACLGSETSGSLICPAAISNCVTLRATPGLVSRSGAQPITARLDTLGPITRCVRDTAILLQAIAGPDEADPYSLGQPKQKPDYLSHLTTDGLKGVRIGVPRRGLFDDEERTALKGWPVYEKAFQKLRELGAEVVDPADFDDFKVVHPDDMLGKPELIDMKEEMAAFLATYQHVPSGVATMQNLVEYNKQHADVELPEHYESQALFEASASTKGYDQEYLGQVYATRSAAQHQVNEVLRRHKLDAIVMPIVGDGPAPGISSLCGYPTISVPVGYLPDDSPARLDEADHAKQMLINFPGAPLGLIFMGQAWSEASLLGYAYAFEQGTQHRGQRRVRPEAIPRSSLGSIKHAKGPDA